MSSVNFMFCDLNFWKIYPFRILLMCLVTMAYSWKHLSITSIDCILSHMKTSYVILFFSALFVLLYLIQILLICYCSDRELILLDSPLVPQEIICSKIWIFELSVSIAWMQRGFFCAILRELGLHIRQFREVPLCLQKVDDHGAF